MSSSKDVEYQPLVEKEDFELRPAAPRKPSWMLWAAQAMILACSFVMFVQSWRQSKASGNCLERTSMYSPVLGAFQEEYKEVRFMGTLAGFSPFKGPPDEHVDEAWEKILAASPFGVDKETLIKIKAPNIDSALQFPPELGGGYMVDYEAQHQLHCLNMLWQHTWIDYYQNKSMMWSDPPDLVRTHLDHCADLLRQKLMCDADVGLVTYNWVKNHPRPYPNFNVMHKCRANYEDYLDWAHNNAVLWPQGQKLPILPGAIELDEYP